MADIAAQRLKAVEQVSVQGERWENAQYMELITPENRGFVSTPADLATIVAERKTKLKLAPGQASDGYSKRHGRGSIRTAS